uniref:Uncharacterized protein n=1 Tax=Octopus bimaculoides TaxID=37653 RepID=A0A0L8HQL0_OCTBM
MAIWINRIKTTCENEFLVTCVNIFHKELVLSILMPIAHKLNNYSFRSNYFNDTIPINQSDSLTTATHSTSLLKLNDGSLVIESDDNTFALLDFSFILFLLLGSAYGSLFTR